MFKAPPYNEFKSWAFGKKNLIPSVYLLPKKRPYKGIVAPILEIRDIMEGKRHYYFG